MKKLMIAAAIAMIAGLTQAANAKWNVSNVRIPVATNVKIDQTGIVTTTDSDKFAAGALTISLFYQGVDAETNPAWKLITSAATTGEGAKGTADFWTQAQAEAVFEEIGDKTVNFKITADYTTADGVYSYTGTTSKDLKSIASSAQTVSFNMNNVGSWDYKANGGGDTPEPTSGLLLLIGVAGLALRRRRA